MGPSSSRVGTMDAHAPQRVAAAARILTASDATMTIHSLVRAVTERIREPRRDSRRASLQRLAQNRDRDRGSDRMGCANVAPAVAGIPANDKFKVVSER